MQSIPIMLQRAYTDTCELGRQNALPANLIFRLEALEVNTIQ